MSEALIADPSGVKPGEEGYIKTLKPVIPDVKKDTDTVVVKPEKPETIPYARFEEINTKRKDAELKLEKFKEDQKKVNDKKLEEDGKVKELWETEKTEHAKTKIKADEWDKYEKERKEALLGKIPEKDREIYEELSLIKLEKVVEKYSKDGSLGVVVDGPEGHTDLTSEERKKILSGTAAEKRDGHKKLLDFYKTKK